MSILLLLVAEVGEVHSAEGIRYYSSAVFNIEDASPLPDITSREHIKWLKRTHCTNSVIITQAHLGYFKRNRSFRKKMPRAIGLFANRGVLQPTINCAAS